MGKTFLYEKFLGNFWGTNSQKMLKPPPPLGEDNGAYMGKTYGEENEDNN